MPGIGEEKASRIAYRSLTRYLGANSNYADARSGAIQAATDLYGACSVEVIATTNTWAAVGVGTSTSPYCSGEISGQFQFCIENGPNVYPEYRVPASPGATKTWSADNPAFGFSQLGQVDFAVLTQVPTYADATMLSVYIAHPNPSANMWRYYHVSTAVCNPTPPNCPPGQLCEVRMGQRTSPSKSTNQEITVSPNPADALVTLDLATPTVASTVLFIKDMLGRTLHTQLVPLGQRSVSIDVARLPAGSFIVTIASATGTTSKRFQVSR